MSQTAKSAVNIQQTAASNPVHETDAEPDDHELVARCQRGDLGAYEQLVCRHRQRMFQLAYSMVRNEADATDIVQEAFVHAWQGLRRFHRQASFSTWLYRITTNLCIDLARRRQRRPTVAFADTIQPDTDAAAPEPPSTNPSPVDEVLHRELARQIDAAIAQLSPDHRAVIQLREFEGLEYTEIARAVGCSIGTVMSRLHYARKHLQKLLKEAR